MLRASWRRNRLTGNVLHGGLRPVRRRPKRGKGLLAGRAFHQGFRFLSLLQIPVAARHGHRHGEVDVPVQQPRKGHDPFFVAACFEQRVFRIGRGDEKVWLV